MYQDDTRGSSITVEYVLTLLVALSLLGGVSAAVGSLDDRQEKQIATDQLEVAGNEIAVQLEHQYLSRQRTQHAEQIADEAGYSGDPFEFTSEYHVDTPERVATGTYTAQISGDNTIVLTSSAAGSPTVAVPIRDEIPVREASGAPGDEVMIVYDESADEFVLQGRGGDSV